MIIQIQEWQLSLSEKKNVLHKDELQTLKKVNDMQERTVG